MSGSGSPSRFVKPAGNTHLAPSLIAQQAEPVQLVDDGLELVVVEALADVVGVGEPHVQPVVDGRRSTSSDSATSDRHSRRVVGSPACRATTRRRARSLNVGSASNFAAGRLVEAVQVTDGQLVGGLGLADVEQVLDQHAERRAPLADVVLPDDRVAQPLQQPHRRVADDRRAQVPDVHLLGRVRRRVVDDDRLRCSVGRDPEPIVAHSLHQQLTEQRRRRRSG